jgi:hypothetical protein
MITYSGHFLVDSTGKRITKSDGSQLVLGPQKIVATGGVTGTYLLDSLITNNPSTGDCFYSYGNQYPSAIGIGVVHHADGTWATIFGHVFYYWPTTGLSIGDTCVPSGSGIVATTPETDLTFSCP